MQIKDILVHMDSSKAAAARLDLAVALASRYNARLTGIYVLVRAQVPQFIQAHVGPEVIETQHRVMRQMAADVEKMFRDKVDAAGLLSEWRSVEGELVDVVSLHARYADLAVIGQFDPDGEGAPGSEEFADRMILNAGRPVLVVPYIGIPATVGANIMIAWDSSRLAARAVNDALPLLVDAKKVEVLAVNPHGGIDGHGEVPGADISLHLARHGVKAEAQHIVADDVDPANMILSRAADEGVDLIVMGAYGHRRLRELVLGGVTRHMLRHMTVPVLMSH